MGKIHAVCMNIDRNNQKRKAQVCKNNSNVPRGFNFDGQNSKCVANVANLT